MSDTVVPKRIGDMLVDEHVISPKMLDEALEKQKKDGGKIVEVLIQLGYLSINEFVKFLGHQPGIASIDIAHYQIPQEIIDLVPQDIDFDHEVFPIDRMGSLLTVGMVCPLDTKTIEQIRDLTGLRVKPILCSAEDIRGAISRYYPQDKFIQAPAPKAEPVPAPKVLSLIHISEPTRPY